LWLLSCLLSSLRTINQITHNGNRRSVSGLSLFDTESRKYGKIPWLFFACAFGSTDWWILSINCLGILLATIVLVQFLHYSEKAPYRRIIIAFLLLISTFTLMTKLDLSKYQYVSTLIPVLVSLILVPLASRSQYVQNCKHTCKAVTFNRYSMYCVANFCALAYGIGKFQLIGLEQTWPIILVASVGLTSNCILVRQIIREGSYPEFINGILKVRKTGAQMQNA
jgi:hypothetical protein